MLNTEWFSKTRAKLTFILILLISIFYLNQMLANLENSNTRPQTPQLWRRNNLYSFPHWFSFLFIWRCKMLGIVHILLNSKGDRVFTARGWIEANMIWHLLFALVTFVYLKTCPQLSVSTSSTLFSSPTLNAPSTVYSQPCSCVLNSSARWKHSTKSSMSAKASTQFSLFKFW